eukprot:CAMPEP_0183455666 /NCGR_PEP_ID=MMETSP0370-20130417/127160_1 /TAXON_ID=268820 /ORGANISM="Peridinium aciculiferum, Strain PAER-2" /LENGTH=66 /DNA_ID=CAMNT_0025647265 /DNA_START=29 /DNA_END=227 /DNA_ORIENTATION=+
MTLTLDKGKNGVPQIDWKTMWHTLPPALAQKNLMDAGPRRPQSRVNRMGSLVALLPTVAAARDFAA